MATYLSLDEMKTHLRVDFDDDDAYIYELIDLVEELVHTEITGSVVGEGTVTTAGTTALVGDETNFTAFDVGDTITVEGEKLRTIATITSDEALTVSVAFTTSDSDLTYTVHSKMPLVGDQLPQALRHGMKMMVGHFYNNREATITGVGMTEIPFGYKHLVDRYKNWTVA